MKTKEIEVITKRTVYVANDGTEFNNSIECEKYDNTAIGVLRSRINPLVVNKGTEYTVFGFGNDDAPCWVVFPRTTEDIMLIRQLLLAYGNSIEYAEKLGDDDVEKYIILTWSYDNDSLWFSTLDDIFESVTKKKF